VAQWLKHSAISTNTESPGIFEKLSQLIQQEMATHLWSRAGEAVGGEGEEWHSTSVTSLQTVQVEFLTVTSPHSVWLWGFKFLMGLSFDICDVF